MKRSIVLAVTVAAAGLLVMPGCGTLNSALVTGQNQSLLAVNMETDGVIGSVTMPAAAAIPTGLRTPVLTFDSTVAFLTGGDDLTYQLRIDETSITLSAAPPVPIPDDGRVLDSAAVNPWTLVRSNPDPGGFALTANNTFDLRTAVSSVAFPDFFEQAVVCDDGSTVLVRQTYPARIRLFTLDRAGVLVDTGHALDLDSTPMWVACAPGAAAGAVMLPVGADASVVSFRIDPTAGLTRADTAVSHAVASGAMGPINNSVAFAFDGSGLFLRSSSIIGDGQDGWIERLSFDPATAMLGDTASYTSRAGVSYVAGLHQIGVHPEGGRIYLPNAFTLGGRIDILDATTGARMGGLTHADMPNPVEFVVEH